MKKLKAKFAVAHGAILITCATLLSGCVTTQGAPTGADLGEKLGAALFGTQTQPNTGASRSVAPASISEARQGIRAIGETELYGLFTSKPLRMPNGLNAQFPRVAITVDSHFVEKFKRPLANQCYFMHARIWDSATKSRDVAPFSVCGADIKEPSGGFLRADSSINIWNSGISTASQDHTGSTRTEGPKPPVRPIPSGPLDAVSVSTSDVAYFFVHGTLTSMNFDFTQTDPRVWFVKFGTLDAAGFRTYQDSAQRQVKPKTEERPGSPASVSSVPSASATSETRPASAKRPVGPAMSYATMIKTISAAKGHVPTVNSKLVGKAVQLTLKAPGPDSLVVDVADEIFFRCLQRAPGFKGGKITSVIAGYEDDENGHGFMVVLERCP